MADTRLRAAATAYVAERVRAPGSRHERTTNPVAAYRAFGKRRAAAPRHLLAFGEFPSDSFVLRPSSRHATYRVALAAIAVSNNAASNIAATNIARSGIAGLRGMLIGSTRWRSARLLR